jgi:hypothetical protein
MKGLFTRGLVGGLAVVAAASAFMVGPANAWPTLGVCQYVAETNMNECSYINPDGIKSVFISLDTDDGILVVVNETYDCETPVFVEWENLGPTHHYEVEACPPDPAVPDPDPLPVGIYVEPPMPPRVIDDLKQAPGPVRHPGASSQTFFAGSR